MAHFDPPTPEAGRAALDRMPLILGLHEDCRGGAPPMLSYWANPPKREVGVSHQLGFRWIHVQTRFLEPDDDPESWRRSLDGQCVHHVLLSSFHFGVPVAFPLRVELDRDPIPFDVTGVDGMDSIDVNVVHGRFPTWAGWAEIGAAFVTIRGGGCDFRSLGLTTIAPANVGLADVIRWSTPETDG